MTLVLDTTILIEIKNRNEEIIKKLKDLSLVYSQPAKITFITQFEFLFGIKEKNSRNQEKALDMLNQFVILHTTDKTANILSNLKYNYEKKGINFKLADLIIASLVIENNLILLTQDTDFEKLDELNKIIIK